MSTAATPAAASKDGPASGADSAPAKSPARSQSPAKSPGRVTRSSAGKKESFQWNTPADEFAEDVASDAEEDVEFIGVDRGSPIEAEIDGERYKAHRTEDGEIIIHLGVEEAERFAVDDPDAPTTAKIVSAKGGEETNEEIQKFLDDYKEKGKDGKGKKKQVKSKQKFQCPKCDKIWNWPWELRRHVLTHYKEKERQETATFKCDECGRGFQWKRDLAQHKRLHTGEKLLVCSVCEKKFTTRQALLHHVVVHTGEKPFQCAVCGNRFTQPANLRTHMKKKHESHDIKGNKCPHCSETFPSIIAVHQHILEDHQNIVAEEREIQNMEKMKKEQEKAERERRREENRRKRLERKKEKMDYHDFRAKGLQEWEINYEFHIGEGLVKGVDWDRTPSNGELPCEICERKFGWRYEMMFHNLCHKTDEAGHTKNRVCPECDTAFKVPIGLKHHLLLHTGELPFLCLHCWRSFSSHIDLKLHIRKEHLSHLEPQVPTPPAAKTPKTPREPAVKRTPKRLKTEAVAAATAVTTHQQLTEQQLVAAVQAATGGDASGLAALGENVQVMVANQEGENGEGQTILVNSDGTIVHTGDQDMIVVIQSDDGTLEQAQVAGSAASVQMAAAAAGAPPGSQLIVVDPSQMQQVVGADGVPMTIVETGGAGAGETMILGEGDAARVLQMAGGSLPEGAQVVVANPGTSVAAAAAEGQVRYVLASPTGGQPQQAVAISDFHPAAVATTAGTTTTTTTLVMEAASPQAANGGAEEGTMIVGDAPEEAQQQAAGINGEVAEEAAVAAEVEPADTKAGIVEKKMVVVAQSGEGESPSTS